MLRTSYELVEFIEKNINKIFLYILLDCKYLYVIIKLRDINIKLINLKASGKFGATYKYLE